MRLMWWKAASHSQHEPHLPLSRMLSRPHIGEDGMMTIQCKSQAMTETIEAVSNACGIPKENIRMILNTVGGSFGYSVSPHTYALAVTAVQNLNMPVEAHFKL